MYVKRKLGVGDLMPAVRIVGKIGVSDFKKCFSADTVKNMIKNGTPDGETSDVMIEKIGFETVLNALDVLLVNIPKCEQDMYEFMASMCQVSVDEFKEFPPSAFVDVLQEIFTAEAAKDFFSHVSRLLNLTK